MSALSGKKWVCDVCKVREFTDFDEACRHEEVCQGSHALAVKVAENGARLKAAAPINVVIVDSDVTPEKESVLVVGSGPQGGKVAREAGEGGGRARPVVGALLLPPSGARSKVAKVSEGAKVSKNGASVPVRKSKRKVTKKAPKSSSPNSFFMTPKEKEKAKAKAKAKAEAEAKKVAELEAEAEAERLRVAASKSLLAKSKSKKAKKAASVTSSSNPFFMTPKEKAEVERQRAEARRKAKRAKMEVAKSKSREVRVCMLARFHADALFPRLTCFLLTALYFFRLLTHPNQTKSTKLDSLLQNSTKPPSAASASFFAKKKPLPRSSKLVEGADFLKAETSAVPSKVAPLFPVPSHVMLVQKRGSDDLNSTGRSNFPPKRRQAATNQIPSSDAAPVPISPLMCSSGSSLPTASTSISEIQCLLSCPPLPPTPASTSSFLENLCPAATDFQKDLKRAKKARQRAEMASQSSALITQVYAPSLIPDDICGEHNKVAAAKFLEFLRKWQDKLREMREMQGKKKRRKSKKNSLWYDEDYDSDEDDDGTPLTFVLCGPPGTGKTCMVHAAVKELGGHVLEVNTMENRGNTSLKKKIEEATQSQKFSAIDDNAMTVILMDEADVVFESHGDGGFWTAVKFLAKRSKCPIVITCNYLPKHLSTIKSETFYTSRPTVEECVYGVGLVLEAEGIEGGGLEGISKVSLLRTVLQPHKCAPVFVCSPPINPRRCCPVSVHVNVRLTSSFSNR